MLEIQASAFVSALSHLAKHLKIIELQKKRGENLNRPIGDAALRKMFTDIARTLLVNALTLDAQVTYAAIDELGKDLAKDQFTWERLERRLREVENTLRRELATRRIFVLETRRARYYASADELYGADFIERFPALTDDIEGAGHCLAVGEGTASVLHLVRVMEAGLKELAKTLEIAYAPSWDAYLKKIQAKLDEKPERRDAKWKREYEFYRDISGDLISIKQAWRNPSMHIERKYGPHEAEEIFTAVKTLMQRLAAGLASL